MYADDTTLYTAGKMLEETIEHLAQVHAHSMLDL